LQSFPGPSATDIVVDAAHTIVAAKTVFSFEFFISRLHGTRGVAVTDHQCLAFEDTPPPNCKTKIGNIPIKAPRSKVGFLAFSLTAPHRTAPHRTAREDFNIQQTCAEQILRLHLARLGEIDAGVRGPKRKTPGVA
jgi:hypothetical protein